MTGRVCTVRFLQHALDGARAAGAVHLDVEFIGVVCHFCFCFFLFLVSWDRVRDRGGAA